KSSDEDIPHSRTYLHARRASNVSLASSYRSSSISQIPERSSDQFGTTGSAEREREDIRAADQQWKTLEHSRRTLERRQSATSQDQNIPERISLASMSSSSEGARPGPASSTRRPIVRQGSSLGEDTRSPLSSPTSQGRMA